MKKRVISICLLVFLLFASRLPFWQSVEKKQVAGIESNTIGALLSEEIDEAKNSIDKLQCLSMEEIVSENPNIEKLYWSRPTQEDIELIGKLNDLKELRLDIGYACHPDLSCLENLWQLERIHIEELEGLEKRVYLGEDASLDYSFLYALEQLKEVDIWVEGIEDLSYFSHMKELERLSLKYVETADLQYLEGLGKLKELELQASYVRKNQERLKNLSTLSALSIYRPTQEEINCIGELTGLKELKLENVKASLKLYPLGNLYQLEKLDMDINPGIEEITGDYAFMNRLTQLKEVSIEHLENLSCFQHMEELKSLSVTFLKTADFQYLEKAGKLEELRLAYCDQRLNHEDLAISSLSVLDISNPKQEEIDWIGEMNKLQDLTLVYIDSCLDLSALEKLQDLKKVNMSGLPYTGKLDFSPLGKLKKLEELELWAVDTDYSFLQPLNSLKVIKIYRASIEDLSCFREMKELKELIAERVDKVDFGYLEGLNKLETLDIYFEYWEEGGEVPGTLPNLSELILECNFRPKEAINISFLSGMEKLKGLSITNLPLQSLEPLRGLDNLVWLTLEYVYMDNIKLDVEPISKLKRLERLYIGKVELESVQALGSLGSLIMLTLDSTNVRDIEPLKGLENLRRLYIGGNTSEQVKKQAELYFSHVEDIEIRE